MPCGVYFGKPAEVIYILLIVKSECKNTLRVCAQNIPHSVDNTGTDRNICISFPESIYRIAYLRLSRFYLMRLFLKTFRTDYPAVHYVKIIVPAFRVAAFGTARKLGHIPGQTDRSQLKHRFDYFPRL